MPFQSTVNLNPAPAVQGDFASVNPFASVLAGPGALVAPASGLTVGNFCWVGPAGQVSQSYVAGYQIGFLGRNEQALITNYLGEVSMVVPAGFMVNVFNSGDFWAKFPGGATPGQLVYADPNTGTPIAAASVPAAASATASSGFTGTITTTNGSTTITVVTATAGIIGTGDVLVATGIPTGTTIVSQLTVTSGSGAGLLGTYQISAPATSSNTAEAATTNSTLLRVSAVASGALNAGDVISGTGVTLGTTIGTQNVQFIGVANLASSTTLVVTAVTQGVLRVGDVVVAVGVPTGATIASQSSGTPGGVGTYIMSAAATVTNTGVPLTDGNIPGQTGRYRTATLQNFASTTITVAGTAQATGFFVAGSSTAGNNELAKITTF